MFNVGGLLAVANGALEGVQQNKDVAYQRAQQQQAQQRANLLELARLSEVPGFSIGGAAGNGAPPARWPRARPGRSWRRRAGNAGAERTHRRR